MTDPNDFYHKPCEKLSAACVDAFVELGEDPTNMQNLVLTSSWGDSSLDMNGIVKANETITHLSLTETALQYDNEAGSVDCISGDDLSGIIKMQKLADVNKTITLQVGMAYVWDGTQFTPQMVGDGGEDASLTAKVDQLQTSVALLQTSNTSLTQEVTILSQQLADLTARVTILENKDNNTEGESNE